MSKKNYVLDTNIFIYEPECLFLFEDNDLFIAPVTLREITHLKDQSGETGYSARRVKRILDDLRDKGGSLKDGLLLGDDLGKLYVIPGVDFDNFKPGMSKHENDDYILAAAAWQSMHDPENKETILVTDDTDMAFLADIIGVKTERFRNKRAKENTIYTGRTLLHLNNKQFSNLVNDKSLEISDILPVNGYEEEFLHKYNPHEFVTIKNCENGSLLGKIAENAKSIEVINEKAQDESMSHPWGIEPRNSGQRFMIRAMMDEDIPLVIVDGPAGTAKTFVSLACGLEQVVNWDIYQQILITRANVEMDASYGYLPGDEKEKVSPMMRPFFDNLKVLAGNQRTTKDGVNCPNTADYFLETKIIVPEAMQYMRGRSIHNTYVIIDEAQNCTPNQILGIVSRIGTGSKIILLGDPEQIDNKILDRYNNGLVFAKTRLADSSLSAQITMEESECVRSPLAAEAAKKLK